MKNKVILVLAPMLAVVLCRFAAADFELTVNLVGPGRIDPNEGTYTEGTTVPMQVWPDDGYWVKSWSGTDDDSSTELTNTVTMDSNTTVVVELGPAIVVTRPSEGDVWAAGSRRVIRWWSYGAGKAQCKEDQDEFFVFSLTIATIVYKHMHIYLWTTLRSVVVGRGRFGFCGGI